jgi:hypothetical protein
MTCRVVGLKRFFVAYFSILVVTFSLVVLLHETFSADQGHLEVDLKDLVANIEDFCAMKIRTKGTVQFWASFYMYEDFWLAADTQSECGIPVVVRNAGLSQPSEYASIEVWGTIEYCELKAGSLIWTQPRGSPLRRWCQERALSDSWTLKAGSTV